MNPKIFFMIFNIALLVIASALIYKMCVVDYGKVSQGENWEAKQYGNRYTVSLKNHSDVTESLTDFVKTKNIKAGSISGLGAVNSATLRFFNPQTKQYVDKTFDEQMEIANLTGNISTKDGEEYLHLHVTLGNSQYNAIAGHLLSATINGAAEFVIDEIPNGKIGRKSDTETGLNVYDFGVQK